MLSTRIGETKRPYLNWQCSAFDWLSVVHRPVRALLAHVDVIRLDHFRGFAVAWQAPAGAQTAQSGQWVAGPGASVFSSSANRLGPSTIHRRGLGYDYGRRAGPARPVCFTRDARPATRLRWSCGQSISA